MKRIILKRAFLVLISISFLSFNGISQHTAGDTTAVPSPPAAAIDSANKVFETVEVDASFPGGDKAWVGFLSNNLNPKVPVKKGAPAGEYTVIVRFIVAKDGSIASIRPMTHFGYGMEEEAVRVIAKSPKWIPAVQNKRKVNAYRSQPITFIVQEEIRKKKKG